MDWQELQKLAGGAKVYPRSVRVVDHEVFALARDGMQQYLLIVFDPHLPAMQRATFSGEVQDLDADTAIKWCLPNRQNAEKLRKLFPFTAPQALGLRKSFGAGDRIGLAAAGHIRAARACDEKGIALVLAQQSISEMARTHRTPDLVLDAATWAAFQEGYEQAWGADADGLQTEADVRTMASAGFTFFTLTASAQVDENAPEYSPADLARRFDAFADAEELMARYADHTFRVADFSVAFTRETLQRAAVKYSRALDHAIELVRLLEKLKGADNFDLEVSLAETQSPTSVVEHYFIARELKRRGVRITSLALRFGGEFEARLQQHAAMARVLGPYKLSLQTDEKFALYPMLARAGGDLLHVKTAGTWYLQALRVVARRDAKLFREICAFCRSRFFIDGANDGVAENLEDDELETLFESENFRQMLNTTFGAVLTDKTENAAWRFRARLYELWQKNEDTHLALVEEYSRQHLKALKWC